MAPSYSTEFACHDASSLDLRSQPTQLAPPAAPNFLTNTLDILKRIESKAKAKAKQPEAPTRVPQIRLGEWSETKRGVPNVFLRSELFSAAHKRIWVDRMLLQSLGDVKIFLTGVHFNQKDLDYFLELLHLQRLQPLNQSIQFTASSLLKSLRLSVGNYQYTELKDVIARLQANTIEVRISEEAVFGGSLIEKIERDGTSKVYLVWLNPQLLNLFKNGYTQIDSAQRHKLGKHMLAKALHGMYSTHAAPYRFKVATIRKLTGSTTQDLSKFRQQLRDALNALKGVNSIRDDSMIDSKDLVNVCRDPTRSQKRHLAKKHLK